MSFFSDEAKKMVIEGVQEEVRAIIDASGNSRDTTEQETEPPQNKCPKKQSSLMSLLDDIVNLPSAISSSPDSQEKAERSSKVFMLILTLILLSGGNAVSLNLLILQEWPRSIFALVHQFHQRGNKKVLLASR